MVSVSIDVYGIFDQILKLVPETTNVAVVIGSSPIEKRWLEEMRRVLQPFTERVTITYFNELSLEEILGRVASLPPRSIIIYAQMLVDAAGVVHEGGRAMSDFTRSPTLPCFPIRILFSARGSSAAGWPTSRTSVGGPPVWP